MKKVINLIINIVFAILLLLSCIVFIPRCFGIKAYSVAGVSMEPTIHIGTLVYAKPMEFNKYKVNDIVVFRDRGNDVVHRIVDINCDEKSFKTRGDANNVDDLNAVNFQNVRGRTVFYIPFLGYILGVLSFKITKIIIGMILLLLLLLNILIKTKDGGFTDGKTNIKN